MTILPSSTHVAEQSSRRRKSSRHGPEVVLNHNRLVRLEVACIMVVLRMVAMVVTTIATTTPPGGIIMTEAFAVLSPHWSTTKKLYLPKKSLCSIADNHSLFVTTSPFRSFNEDLRIGTGSPNFGKIVTGFRKDRTEFDLGIQMVLPKPAANRCIPLFVTNMSQHSLFYPSISNKPRNGMTTMVLSQSQITSASLPQTIPPTALLRQGILGWDNRRVGPLIPSKGSVSLTPCITTSASNSLRRDRGVLGFTIDRTSEDEPHAFPSTHAHHGVLSHQSCNTATGRRVGHTALDSATGSNSGCSGTSPSLTTTSTNSGSKGSSSMTQRKHRSSLFSASSSESYSSSGSMGAHHGGEHRNDCRPSPIDASRWNAMPLPSSMISSSSSSSWTLTAGHSILKRNHKGNRGQQQPPYERFDSFYPGRYLPGNNVPSMTEQDYWSEGIIPEAFGSAASLPYIERQLKQFSLSELKQLCQQRGLKLSGRKAELQERLMGWMKDKWADQYAKQQQPETKPVNDAFLWNYAWDDDQDLFMFECEKDQSNTDPPVDSPVPNSLAEWSRTVDLAPLLQRREVIHKEKLQGKPVEKKSRQTPVQPESNMPTSEYVSILRKIFEKPSSPFSNREVKQMYQAAKHADQMGDRALAKRILTELKEATPHDARIYRRLARMEKEDGNVQAARAILQEALHGGLHSDNAFLWHGLAQLSETEEKKKECYEKAIELDPSFPNPYHALGTLQHSQGRIANAMKTLKEGVSFCPTNHRLHHALGDLYRDAKMLDMAERSYRKALSYGPAVSNGFAYTALAYVAYDQGKIEESRSWLRKALSQNKGRQANAWVSLAQLEESEGYYERARQLCSTGIALYERGILQRTGNRDKLSPGDERALLEDPVAVKNELLHQIPRYRSGDRFFNLYRTWARIEERYGTAESVDEVYQRALVVFPDNWRLAVDWAEYYDQLRIHGRARELYARACSVTGNRHSEPYRLYAQFEMNLSNYTSARRILYTGARILTGAVKGSKRVDLGLAELLHTWALCEWHLGDLGRAESLLDHSLRMIDETRQGDELRSYILYSLARLEYSRDEMILSQHCIALCLKENSMPGGNGPVFDLWELVATNRGDEAIAAECRSLSEKCRMDEENNHTTNVSRLLSMKRSGTDAIDVSMLVASSGNDMEQLTRREPWHYKIFGAGRKPSNFYNAVRFPDLPGSHLRTEGKIRVLDKNSLPSGTV